MSGVAGGNRIEKQDVRNTFNRYVEEVLSTIPGFKKATLSGSTKNLSKPDYGDLDLVIWFEGNDKREVKQRIITKISSLPQDVIVPFKSEKNLGKRHYNSGELISILYPVVGKENEFIQIDNIVALSEEEYTFKESFLDLPAEKQGLLIGLAKVILLEEEPREVFNRMGITGLPKIKKGEELEFNLSSVKLTLRKVKLDNFKEVSREEIWATANWGLIKILFRKYNIDGSFEDMLDSVSRNLQNSRSKKRVVGVFKSMITVKSGEVGTPKGTNKESALEKVSQTLAEALEDQQKVVALYAGGFKPPHKAHFENAKILSEQADELIIFVGPKVREGVKITAEQSKAVWEIYAEYIVTPTTVKISAITPIRDVYEWAEDNVDIVDKIITGTMPDEKNKFSYFNKNKEKYGKVEIIELPVIVSKEDDKFSATEIRKSKEYMISGKWIPTVLSKEDKQKVINIVTPKEELSIEGRMLETIDTVLENIINKKEQPEQRLDELTPIASTSIIPSSEREELIVFYNDLKKTVDTEKYNLEFQQDRILIRIKRPDEIGSDYTPYQTRIVEDVEEGEADFNYLPYLASILEYMVEQGANIMPLPDIKIKKDPEQLDSFFGKTAYYDPNSQELVLYVLDRLPKDVCRSFCHEMIHHIQTIEGRLGKITTDNTTEDDHLQKIEDEAYLMGNRYFRNWEDTVKNQDSKKETLMEGRYDAISNRVSSLVFRAWKKQIEEGEEVATIVEVGIEAEFGTFTVEATLFTEAGTGNMVVLGTTGAGYKKDEDFIVIEMEIDPTLFPNHWEELSMTLKDIIRHEIEHLTHTIGRGVSVASKGMADQQEERDSANRRARKGSRKGKADYLVLDKEVDANIQGLLFRAKKQKVPFAQVVNKYLDLVGLTPKGKQEVLTVWRKRLPALGIKRPL